MKFVLRRLAHVVSILVLLSACQSIVRSQSLPDSTLSNDEEARNRQRTADNAAAIASILSRIDLRQAIEDQRRAEEESKSFPQNIWQGLKTSTGSNYVLAFFAAIAALIGACTLRSIDKQTTAILLQTEQTDRHFRLANQQFLDVGNWSCKLLDIDGYIHSGFIWFTVTNNTRLPIKNLLTIDCFTTGESKYRNRPTVEPRNPLGLGEPYDVPGVCFLLTDEQKEDINDFGKNIWVSIVGRMTFVDGIGDYQVQFFGQTCQLHRTDTAVPITLHANPKEEWARMEDAEREEEKERRGDG